MNTQNYARKTLGTKWACSGPKKSIACMQVCVCEGYPNFESMCESKKPRPNKDESTRHAAWQLGQNNGRDFLTETEMGRERAMWVGNESTHDLE